MKWLIYVLFTIICNVSFAQVDTCFTQKQIHQISETLDSLYYIDSVNNQLISLKPSLIEDLEYENYDDWFIPSSKSAEEIFNNLHASGFGDFNEEVFYWTSTKAGYQPYVINFNINFEGKTFLGSCFNTNHIIIVRHINPQI